MDCILFDCDGVLIDSEAVVLGVLRERFGRALGGHTDVGPELAHLLGLPVEAIAEAMEQRYRMRFGPEWIRAAREAIAAALGALAEPIPDVAWALERIALPKAVVSNSDLAHVHQALARTGLAVFFGDAVFASELVEHPKPAPDVYRHAAISLGFPPERCVAVEDSRAGVSAAVAAGMTVIGFTGGGHIPRGHDSTQRELGAAASIASMRELPSTVKHLSGNQE